MSFLFKKWGNKRNSMEPSSAQEHAHNNNTNISHSSPPSSPPQVIKTKQQASSLDEDEFVTLEKSPRNSNEPNLSPLVPVSTSPLHEPVLDNDDTLYNNWLQTERKNKIREEKSSNQNNNTSNQPNTSNTNNNLSQRLTTKDVQKYTTHNPTNSSITISSSTSPRSNSSPPPLKTQQTSPRSSTNPVPKPPIQPPPPPKAKASTLPPKAPKTNSFVCPVCNTILYTNDETAVNFHVDECLAKSMNATAVSKPSKPSTAPSQQRSNQGYRNNDDSPFLISCPYIGCSQKMEARYFYNHAILQHSTAAQGYACPICFLAGIQYAPRSDTNLLSHLQSTHSDLAAVVPQPPSAPQQKSNTSSYPSSDYVDDDFEEYDPAAFLVDDVIIRDNDVVVATPDIKSLGSKYVEDTMKDAKPGVECTICFEEFEDGDVIARMDCFCVFHKKCIDLWLKKAKKCPLHQD